MLITDVKKDSTVTVEIEVQGQPVMITTKVLLGLKDGLLVERIMIGDGDLVWRRPSVVTILDANDGNTYIFDTVSIEPMETQFGQVHKIVGIGEGKRKQMRKAERLEVIRMGTCFCHGTTYKAIIYDISHTGIAVILDGNVRMRIGDKCTIRFSMGDVEDGLHIFELSAEVVRFFDVQGRVAVGCNVAQMPEELMILANQREWDRRLKEEEDALAEDGDL